MKYIKTIINKGHYRLENLLKELSRMAQKIKNIRGKLR